MPSPKDFQYSTVLRTGTTLIGALQRDITNALRVLSDGTEIKVEVTVYNSKKEKERVRTEQQNKYYHKLLDIICDYTGSTHKELHEDLKFLFLAYPYIKGEKEYWLIKSTKDLTSKNFGDYLEKVFNWAVTEHGLVLPSSSDYYP